MTPTRAAFPNRIWLALFLLLAACSPNPAALQGTVAARLSSLASSTPQPMYTSLPTLTPQPTLTAQASATPEPTFTAQSAEVVVITAAPGAAQGGATVFPAGPVSGAFLPADTTPIQPTNAAQLERMASIAEPGVTNLGFSPDGGWLFTSAYQEVVRTSTLKVWDLRSGRQTFSLPGVEIAHFSPDGQRLAAMTPNTITFWNPATGEQQEVINTTFYVAAFSPDWRYLALNTLYDTTIQKSTLVVLDLKNNQRELYQLFIDGAIFALRFSPDSAHLAVSAEKTTAAGALSADISLLDASRGNLLDSLRDVSSLVFSPDGRLAAGLSGPAGQLIIYEARDLGAGRAPFPAELNAPSRFSFSPKGNLLAAAYADKLSLLDVESGVEAFALHATGALPTFSPDGRFLAIANYQGAIAFFAVQP